MNINTKIYKQWHAHILPQSHKAVPVGLSVDVFDKFEIH